MIPDKHQVVRQHVYIFNKCLLTLLNQSQKVTG